MNIRDIARIANVTPGTVSKVLNNYPDISEATRQHVIQVINEYQYKPTVGSKAAHNFGKKPIIGLIIEGVHNPLSSEMKDQVSVRLHNEDFTIVNFNDNYYTQDKKEKFSEVLSYAENHSFIGLIYVGGNFSEVPKEMFDKLPCQTIFVNTVLPISFGETNYSSVNCNNFETGYHQMKSLIEAGHKNIAMMISSLEDNSIYGLRMNGYRAALSEAGIRVDNENVVIGDYQITKSHHSMKAYLEKHPETTAVCISADVMALPVLRAAYDIGRKPGIDLEVVGIDGLELTGFLVPSVTTYALPKKEIAETVYDLITGLLDGSKQHQHIMFNTKRIERESTGIFQK